MYDNVVHCIVVTIKGLIWNKTNRENIKKHGVKEREVEEACQGEFENQPTYGNRVMIFGKTKKGRELTIVLIEKEDSNCLVITARDMSKKERRYFLND